MINRRIASLCVLALLAGCGGGGGGSSAIPTTNKSPQLGSLVYTLKVPAKSSQALAHARGSLHPLYDSPATQGVGISIVPSTSTLPAPTNPTIAFDLTQPCTSANFCTANTDGSKSYTLTSPPVPLGTYNVNITTWDAPPSTGIFTPPVPTAPPTSPPLFVRHPQVPITTPTPTPTPAPTPNPGAHMLSDATATVAISGTNSAINVTLNGVPSSVVALPIPGQTHAVLNGNGSAYNIIGNVATQWQVTALDADGYIIAGNGAPNITFTDSTKSFTEANVGAPSNAYTITAVQAQGGLVTLSFSAKGLGPSGVVSSTGSVSLQPEQELWQVVSSQCESTCTGAGVGLFGYALDPGNNYQPDSVPCCSSGYLANDSYATSDNYQTIAQDSSGMLWVYDATTHQLLQFAQSTAGNPSPTGVKISTAGLTLAGISADANGYLYGVDTTANQLLAWQVVGTSTPSLKLQKADSNTGAHGVSVVPNAAMGLPAGAAGYVLVGDDAGVTFYTNASTGALTIATTQPGQYGTPGVYSAAVSSDTGLVWALDKGGTVGTYTIGAGPVLVTQSNSTPSEFSETGYIVAGFDAFGYTSDAQPNSGPDTNEYTFNFCCGWQNNFNNNNTNVTPGILITP